MGGVDLADTYVSNYRTKIRAKKSIIGALVDLLVLVVTNSWIEYRNDGKLMDLAAKDPLVQFELSNTVVETLIRAHVNNCKKSEMH
ncbi:hypothetical protein HPB52_011532 [Rhipicephalus sanguineus]|uniref:Uncharacterized protein n=1 Tax=Rhipicephalus sanguineus TaxID=34632 RepID=A0A9D4YPJ1_RHISA|nr:hypothetical protein HPB52_011532 [Rhipicephalus sanguineus]